MNTTRTKRLLCVTAIGCVVFAVLSWTMRKHPRFMLLRKAPTVAYGIQTPDDKSLDSLSDQYSKLYAERKKLNRTAKNPQSQLPARFVSKQKQFDNELCKPVVGAQVIQSKQDSAHNANIREKTNALEAKIQLWRDTVKLQAKFQAKKALDINGKRLGEVSDALGQKLRDKRKGFQIRLHGTIYQAYVADLEVEQVRMHLNQDSIRKIKFSNLNRLRSYYTQQGVTPTMITNAGMFHPNQEPVGLLVENGVVRGQLNTKNPTTDENFYLRPNGVFYVDDHNLAHIDSTAGFRKLWEVPQRRQEVMEATQSGPMLVIDKKINSHFGELSANAKIRSGVGIINDNGNDGGRVVFLATEGESTFYDFATTFRDLFGCANALFLDGAISRMYLVNESVSSFSSGYFGPMLAVIPRATVPKGSKEKAPATPASAVREAVKESNTPKQAAKPVPKKDTTIGKVVEKSRLDKVRAVSPASQRGGELAPVSVKGPAK